MTASARRLPGLKRLPLAVRGASQAPIEQNKITALLTQRAEALTERRRMLALRAAVQQARCSLVDTGYRAPAWLRRWQRRACRQP